MKLHQVILMEVPTSSTKTTGTGIENNHKISDYNNKGWRQRGLVVRVLDFQSAGPRVRSSSLPHDGFVFGCPKFNSSMQYKQPTGQPPASWNFHTFLFN